jgi:CSLREA domain-containing protein
MNRPHRTRPALLRLEARETPAVITVTSLADDTAADGKVTLREAIQAANTDASVDGSAAGSGPDTVAFGPAAAGGTIILGGTPLPAITKDVTIAGPGKGSLTVSGNQQSGVLVVNAGATVVVSGLTIADGKATNLILGVDGRIDSTGGIANSGTLTITDSSVSNNSSGSGFYGGIFNSGTLTVTDSAVVGNSIGSAFGGGGIANDGVLTVVGSTVADNKTGIGAGGGIANGSTAAVTVIDSTVVHNSAAGGGGISSFGVLTVIDSTVANNSVSGLGGGIFSTGKATVTSSAITNNSAGSSGGGIASTTLLVTNSTITGNSAEGGGGISGTAAVTIIHCTIASNSASAFGGGINVLFSEGPTTLHNTIVAGNVDARIFGAVTEDVHGALAPASSFNLIGVGGGLTNGLNGNIVGPTDARLGPLADNGGPTRTVALLPGSPAIDAGGNANVSAEVTSDQRGDGFPRVFNDAADIGAFEVQTLYPPPPPPAPVSTPVLVGGPPGGSARLLSSSGGALALGDPLTLLAPLADLGVAARVAVADVTGDRVPDRVAATGPGAASRVVVFDGATGAVLTVFPPFEAAFTGGVFVAAGDLDGDGRAEVVVTPDRGGGPVVAVYRGSALAAGSAAEVARFFGIEDPDFRGGARPALGDLDGDGRADLVVSAGFLGGPRIAVFDGDSIGGTPVRLVPDFFAFEPSLRNGAFVAAGDVTGDGFAELAFGGGPGGAPRVRVFDGAGLLTAGPFASLDDVPSAQRNNFFAGDSSLRGGVRLTMRDVDGHGQVDLVTGSGEGEPSRVCVYLAASLLTNASPMADQVLDPFGTTLPNGVFVG